jgi:hypothetical protein
MASPEGDSRWNRRCWESDKRGEVGVSIEGIREVERALRHRPRVGNPGAGPKIAQTRFRGEEEPRWDSRIRN